MDVCAAPSTTAGNIGGVAGLVDKQEDPNTVAGCVHRSMVGTAVFGMFERTIVGVMSANLFPFEAGQFRKSNCCFPALNSVAQPVTKKCFIE